MFLDRFVGVASSLRDGRLGGVQGSTEGPVETSDLTTKEHLGLEVLRAGEVLWKKLTAVFAVTGAALPMAALHGIS